MNSLVNRQHVMDLYDFYSELLTKKQREYFDYYYFNDMSLMEIANIYGVSRNAVYDRLTKTYYNLLLFEEKLQLYSRYQKRVKLYQKYENISNVDLEELIKKLKETEW